MKKTLAVIELDAAGRTTVTEASRIESEFSIYMICDQVNDIDLKQIRQQIKIKLHENNKRLNRSSKGRKDRQQAFFSSIPAAEQPSRVDRNY